MISIQGLDKAAVLAALYNGTTGGGMGLLHDLGRDMTVEEGQRYLEAGDDPTRMFGRADPDRRLYFDYVAGRPIKSDLAGDEFNERLYDRDAGAGAAARAIAGLRP